jgi:hypothetical protein
MNLPVLEGRFPPPPVALYFKRRAKRFAQFLVRFGVAVTLNARILCKTPVS